jgi:flagella basal body P-ring formation protein FlgA
MKLITYIIAALVLWSAPSYAAQKEQGDAPKLAEEMKSFVALTPNVTVTGGVVHLGDIFSGTGEYASRVVAYAPHPGNRAVYDARWLLRVANAYKLNWRPGSEAEHLVVERASQIVTKSAIEDLLQQRYIHDGGEPSSRAVLSNRTLSVHLPVGDETAAAPALNVEQMSVDSSNNRFTAIIAWGHSKDQRMRLVGQIERISQVPVLTDRVMRGEVIDEANIEWQSLPEDRLPRATITDIEQIVGMAAKRTLTPGKPITATDVRKPLLINRGDTVTIMLTTPMMQLTTKGRALQQGSKGDTIRISNLQSNTVIDAIVTGSGVARVDTAVNLAMR